MSTLVEAAEAGKLLTADEVARLLQVPKSWVYRDAARGPFRRSVAVGTLGSIRPISSAGSASRKATLPPLSPPDSSAPSSGRVAPLLRDAATAGRRAPSTKARPRLDRRSEHRRAT